MKDKKLTFYTELAYPVGLALLAFGTAFMTKSDFGISTVIAPAYVLHLKFQPALGFLTFGTAAYLVEALIIVITSLVTRRFKLYYLFSFATAVIYGYALDGAIWCTAPLSAESFGARALLYVVGLLLCASGIAFMFQTYFSPEAYELFVKEFSAKFGKDLHRVKLVYDCVSCAAAIAMSFTFFGLLRFEGVKLGTVICALVNGPIIGVFSKIYDRLFEFKDGLKLKKYFN